jgi:hypothetical protein
MPEDDPVYLEAMLRWMNCMHHGFQGNYKLEGIEQRVLLEDLARKYDVAELVEQLGSETRKIVNSFWTWKADFIATIDHIFEMTGDSDARRALEDVLVV